jgi:hypothetical protein
MERLSRSGFKVAPDGSILARYGNPNACYYGAQIQVQIEYTASPKIKFILSEEEIALKYKIDGAEDIVSGKDLPRPFQLAMFSGVEEVYSKNASSEGLKFTLIKAAIHCIDSNEMAFKLAGQIALASWYQLQSGSGQMSLTYNELYYKCPNLFKSLDEDDEDI